MQFILTLLISVRGSKLLKDGFNLSFAGRGGWFDRHTSRVGKPGLDSARCPHPGDPWPLFIIVKAVCMRTGERRLKPASLGLHGGSLPLQCNTATCRSVRITFFLKLESVLPAWTPSRPHCSLVGISLRRLQ